MTVRSEFEAWRRGERKITPPGLDGWSLGFGGWLSAAPTREEAHLALSILEAEHEHRAQQFADVELVAAWWGRALEAPDPHEVYRALFRLGWQRTGDAAPRSPNR